MLKTCRHLQNEYKQLLFNKKLSEFKSKICVRFLSDSKVRVRFAPSPTGQLHLGGFRTALYNYLFARKHDGKFILRIEDTDQTRLVPGAALQMHKIMDWLGISPDESQIKGGDFGPYVQSERLHLYRQYAQQMIDSGAAYRCFCTEKRLELLRKESAKTKTPNIYDRRCLGLSDKEIQEKLDSGMSYTVRFKLSPFTEGFHDLVYGNVSHDVHNLEGDPIILKSDGYPTYHLANVVDDHLMQISHVLRGVEWQVSTPKHILMYRALGWDPPQFGHLPLILNPDGSKLSKRQNDLHISSLREKHYTPESVLNFVSLIGGGFQDKEYSLQRVYSIDDLVSRFDLARIHQNAGRVEMSRLDEINSSVLKHRFQTDRQALVRECCDVIAAHLGQDGLQVSETEVEKRLAWAMDRIHTLGDLLLPDFSFLWSQNIDRTDKLTHETETMKKIVDLLEKSKDFKDFLPKLKKHCKQESLRVPAVMKDLRVLLTGKSDGAPLAELFQILGRKNCLERMHRHL